MVLTPTPSHEPTFLYRPVMLGSASFAILILLLPIYARELGASATAVGGLFTVFTLTILLLRPVAGWALDKFGRRSFLLASFVCYTLSMLVFSFSSDLIGLYLARFVQGVGAAFMWMCLRTMVADTVSNERRGQAMGRMVERSVRGSILGAFYGFTLLGFLPLAHAWQWAFLGYAVLALLALLLGWYQVQETQSTPASSTLPSWTAATTRLAMVILLVSFAEALIGPVFLILLTDRFDLSPQTIGAVFAGGMLYAVLPSRTGAWGDRWGHYLVATIGLLIAAVVNISLPHLPSLWWLIGLYTLLSAAWCMVDPQLDALKAAQSTPQNRGRTIARFEFVGGIGAALGPMVGGILYDNVEQIAPFAVNGCFLLLAAGCLLWMKSLAKRPEPFTR